MACLLLEILNGLKRKRSCQAKARALKNKKIRYAVVGQGYISQIAVLPAFEHARGNSLLTALVSDDPVKLKKLAKKYGVEHIYSYDQYDECLTSGAIDAVYIALPNTMHREFTVRAARGGIHVFCEKPMAVDEAKCQAMIDATKRHGVKLMIGYRLHFESANLNAIKIVRSGQLGEPRIFNSVFTMQVKAGNIRLQKQLGGGTLYDIGIYCINAARYLFRAEPIEVQAMTLGSQGRFKEVEEATSAILRFPGERVAAFTCSFGADKTSAYEIIGSKGHLRVDPAYEYADSLEHRLTVNDHTRKRRFARHDQFAPELLYFSECIQQDREPEPSGAEGLADVRIISALYRSAETGQRMEIAPVQRQRRPDAQQEITRPPVKKPQLIHAETPSGGS